MIARYKEVHKNGLDLKFFDGHDLLFDDFQRELQTLSMFHNRKFFVLLGVFSNQLFKDAFAKNSEKIIASDNVILFFEEKGSFPKDPFFDLLQKNTKSQEFAPLTGTKLRTWLKEEFEKRKARTAPMVLEALMNAAGNDLWQLDNEAAKLAAFAKGREITLDDVKLLVKSKVETDIFQTIDAIAAKNKKQALFLLHRHLAAGDNPAYLLSMINYQFRNILIVKDLLVKGKSAGLAGLNPFVARKTEAQAMKFTFEELKKIYRKIFQVDYEIKTGKNDPETALDLLVAEN
jgi:DNA polymerase-3 subunit delta